MLLCGTYVYIILCALQIFLDDDDDD